MNFEKLERVKNEYRNLGRQTDKLLEELYDALPKGHYEHIEEQLYLRLFVVKDIVVAYTKELNAIYRKHNNRKRNY